jgi:hypothetical protein
MGILEDLGLNDKEWEVVEPAPQWQPSPQDEATDTIADKAVAHTRVRLGGGRSVFSDERDKSDEIVKALGDGWVLDQEADNRTPPRKFSANDWLRDQAKVGRGTFNPAKEPVLYQEPIDAVAAREAFAKQFPDENWTPEREQQYKRLVNAYPNPVATAIRHRPSAEPTSDPGFGPVNGAAKTHTPSRSTGSASRSLMEASVATTGRSASFDEASPWASCATTSSAGRSRSVVMPSGSCRGQCEPSAPP